MRYIKFFILAIFDKIKLFPHEVKWFIQRGKRGYSDYDLYNFHEHLTKVISGGFRELSKNTVMYPTQYKDSLSWRKELMDISQGFVDYTNIVINHSKAKEFNNKDIYEEVLLSEEEKFRNIVEKFGKTYPYLWRL